MSLRSAFLMPKRKKVREKKGRDLVQERRKRGLGDKKKGSKKSCHDMVEALVHLGINLSFVNQEQPTSSDYLE